MDDLTESREIQDIMLGVSNKPFDEAGRKVRVIIYYTDGSSHVLFAQKVAVLNRTVEETEAKKYEDPLT